MGSENMEESPEDRLNELVNSVKEIILDGQKHNCLISPRTDAPFLSKFIRAKKYDVDAAVVGIHKYYQNIYENLDSLEGVTASAVAKVFDMKLLRPLKHTVNGTTLVLINCRKWDTSAASFDEVMLSIAYLLEELLLDPQFQMHGCHGIWDLSQIGFHHLRQLSYSRVKFAIKVILERFPTRIAGIHVVNYPSIFLPLFKLIVKLLPKKMQKRTHLHDSGFESLSKIFPPEKLPQFMDGCLDEEEAWNTQVISNLIKRNVPYDIYWKCETDA